MHIDWNNRRVFLMVPKTGTTSLRVILDGFGLMRTFPAHMLMEQAVTVYTYIGDFQKFGFFRNPLDRLISVFLYFKQYEPAANIFMQTFNVSREELNSITNEQFVERFDDLLTVFHWLKHPQVDWLRGATVFDYDNYTAEIQRIADMYAKPLPVIPRLKVASDFGVTPVTNKVINFVKSYFVDDYKFAKETLGKTYD